VAEIQGLLAVYGGKSRSFKRYADELLDCIHAATLTDKAYENPATTIPCIQDRSRSIAVALGQAVSDRAPIPAWLALLWVQKSPDITLKSAAQRCKEQFETLFHQRYTERYGQGISVKPNRVRLELTYKASSLSIRGLRNFRIKGLAGRPYQLPNVGLIRSLIDPIRTLCDEVTEELAPYSRLIAKSDDSSLLNAAYLTLPLTLWPASTREAFACLAREVISEPLALSISDLYRRLQLPIDHIKALTGPLSNALAVHNLGILPPLRASTAHAMVVVYAAGEEPSADGQTQLESTLAVLNLAAAVCFADQKFCDAEFDHLQRWINRQPGLNLGQVHHLKAHVLLAKVRGSAPGPMNKHLDQVSVESRSALGTMMVSLAAADGTITLGEVAILEKAYKLLGISGLHQEIHQHLHERTRPADSEALAQQSADKGGIDSSPAGSEPGVLPAAATRQSGDPLAERDIPPPQPGLVLNRDLIAAVQRDTYKVSKLLASVFDVQEDERLADGSLSRDDEPAPEAATPDQVPPVRDVSPYPQLPALGAKHAIFLQKALSRQVWNRSDLESLAKTMGLMLDGAIEIINEALDDEFHIIAFEGDDIIDINPSVHEHITQ